MKELYNIINTIQREKVAQLFKFVLKSKEDEIKLEVTIQTFDNKILKTGATFEYYSFNIKM